jgi:hypothetical protein
MHISPLGDGVETIALIGATSGIGIGTSPFQRKEDFQRE